MKQIKMLLLTGMLTLFTSYAHAVPVNMTPIISYLLSDTATQTPASTFADFANKTFYVVDDDLGEIYGEFSFNADMTVMSDTYGPISSLSIVGDRLYLTDWGDDYLIIESETADYIQLTEYYNGTVFSTFKFFFTLNAAQTYLYGPIPEVIPMTTDMLSGQVFYTDNGSDFEQISFISSSEVMYREVAIDGLDGSIIGDSGENIFPYTIDSSGTVIIDFYGNTNTYQLISITDTQWDMFINNGNPSSIPYSTWLLNKPTNFPEPVTTTTPTALESFVSGKTFSLDNGAMSVTFGSDYSYSDDGGCTGTWSVIADTMISVPSCGVDFEFVGELVDGMSVTLYFTDPNSTEPPMSVTFTEQMSTPAPTTLAVTEAMLIGKTFYEHVMLGSDVDSYTKMTFENGVLTRTQIDVNATTQQETVYGPSSFDYTIIDGKIRVTVDMNFVDYWFTLNSESADAWALTMEYDMNPKDGVIDPGIAMPTTWYLSKPANFPVSFPTDPVTNPITPSIEGRVIDNAIPGAHVTLMVNDQSVAVAEADSQGYYNIDCDINALNDTDVAVLEAVDPINSQNAFISVLGTGADLKKGLKDDGKVDSTDIPDTSVSNVTTAKYMCAASNGKITSVDDLISYEKVMEDKGATILTTAAAIKYSVDHNNPLTIDGNSSMTMKQFADTVCTQYDQNNSSALSDITETVASYVEGVTKTDIETMNDAIMDPISNPELAANTVKPGMTATQLAPGTYETITMEASHYKDRESYATRHPSTYWGTQDTLRVSLFDTTITTTNELVRFDFPLTYTNGIMIEKLNFPNDTTLTYGSWDKVIAVSDYNSYGVVQTVQDANNYTSYSGFATVVLDWKGAQLDTNGEPVVDPSVNNYFIDASGAVTTDPTLANDVSKDWNLTDEKIETTMSGIMTGIGVSSMPFNVVAGDNGDTNAVDANISILQKDGSWKQVALNLATYSSMVSNLEAGSNGSYTTMTLDGTPLPMSFALEFEAPEGGKIAEANPLMGNISDGTSTDNIAMDYSFFKDGFLYLQIETTTLGYKHIVIDLVNNVGYAFTDYAQVSVDANGNKSTDAGYDPNTAELYWTMERTKVNFVR